MTLNKKLEIISKVTGDSIERLADMSEEYGIITIDDCLEAMQECADHVLNEKVCEWEFDEEHCFYNTECDQAYQLEVGTLEENKHNYCPFCGGKIIVTNKQ